MANICTNCGLKPQYCKCDNEYSKPDIGELGYVTVNFEIPDSWISDFMETYETLEIDSFMAKRSDRRVTPRNVLLFGGFTQMTIDTTTKVAESESESLLTGNLADSKSGFAGTKDGEKKWEKYQELFGDDDGIRSQVARDFKAGRWEEGIIRLCGRDPDTGENKRETYFRPVKASLVAYLAGDDNALCMDRRVFRALKPLLRNMLTERHRAHPEIEDSRMRESTQRQDAIRKDLLKHKTADDMDTDYWCDGMSQNLGEYRAITSHLIKRIADETGVERGAVPIVLFNMTGDMTTHEAVMDRAE